MKKVKRDESCLSLEQRYRLGNLIRIAETEYGVEIGAQEFIDDAFEMLLYKIAEKGYPWYFLYHAMVKNNPCRVTELEELG